MSAADFYSGGKEGAREDRYSIPLDGKHLSIGPFPFRPRSIVLMNQTQANMIAQDDRGEQYIAAQSIGATYGAGDSVRFEVWLDKAQTSGKATVVVSDQPAGISAAQLSSFAAISGGGTIKRVALVDFPPAASIDGDAIALAVATGVEWLLIWNAGTGFWDYIGGPPLFAEQVSFDADALGPAYAALANAGPAIALPRPGDYFVEIGCTFQTSLANNVAALMSYDIGATGAVDADSVAVYHHNSGAGMFTSASRERLKTGLTAVTLTAKYKGLNAGGELIGNRFMAVTPERIQ